MSDGSWQETSRQAHEWASRATAERDAALAVIEQVRELAEDIIEQSHCGYLGKDILDIVGSKRD